MGIVTVYLKFVLKKKSVTPSFMGVIQGDIVISGLESSFTESMKNKFPDLASSTSESSFPVLKLSKESTEDFPYDVQSAISTATEYLNALDEFGFTVVSSTCDSLEIDSEGGQIYKCYLWTLQEGFPFNEKP